MFAVKYLAATPLDKTKVLKWVMSQDGKFQQIYATFYFRSIYFQPNYVTENPVIVGSFKITLAKSHAR